MTYVGIPNNVITVGSPEWLVTDRGSAYNNALLESFCDRLGLSRILGRPRRPTDKPQVEAVFRVIAAELLSGCPGYTAEGAHNAGRDPSKQALLYDIEV